MPRTVGAVLRRLFRRGRNVADTGARSSGAGADACRAAPHSGHRCALHGARDRNAAVLIPTCPAVERVSCPKRSLPSAGGGVRDRKVKTHAKSESPNSCFFGDFLRAAGACPPFSQQTRPTATPADAFLCANFSFLTKSLTNMSSQVYTMPIL